MKYEEFYAEVSNKLKYQLNDERLKEVLMEKGQDLNNITLNPDEYTDYRKMVLISEYAAVIQKSYTTIIQNQHLISKMRNAEGKIVIDYAEDYIISDKDFVIKVKEHNELRKLSKIASKYNVDDIKALNISLIISNAIAEKMKKQYQNVDKQENLVNALEEVIKDVKNRTGSISEIL